MFLDTSKLVELNYFRTKDGEAAIKVLAKMLYDEYAKRCTMEDGVILYRNQGKAELADWLLKLPEGLRDAANDAYEQSVRSVTF